MDRAAAFGYNGVELALLRADEVDVPRMKRRLSATGLEIPCISSGQVFAADRLYFTHPESAAWRACSQVRPEESGAIQGETLRHVRRQETVSQPIQP